MQIATTFDSTKEQLSHMIAGIRAGKTQLPDFQRGWVWDDDHIRSLLGSISESFPVGAGCYSKPETRTCALEAAAGRVRKRAS